MEQFFKNLFARMIAAMSLMQEV